MMKQQQSIIFFGLTLYYWFFFRQAYGHNKLDMPVAYRWTCLRFMPNMATKDAT